MENKRFEIRRYKDYSRSYKMQYYLGAFIMLLLSYAKIYDGDFHWLLVGFLLIFILMTLRLFVPKICWQKSHVSFSNHKISYLVNESIGGTTHIKYSDIKSVELGQNVMFIYTGHKNRKRKVSLKPFSDELRLQIKENFRSIQKEIETLEK